MELLLRKSLDQGQNQVLSISKGYPIWEVIFKNTELQLSLQYDPSFLELRH